MDRAFPDARVEGHQGRLESLSLPDPTDRHVLAVAIHVGANYIVTFNLDDFPAAQLEPHGVKAIHPDGFASLLMDRDREEFIEAAAGHRGSLRKPPLSVNEYLDVLRNSGLEVTTQRLEEHRIRL